MIDLTQAEIKEFQDIYLKVYGEEITKDEAEVKGKRLIRFIAMIINYDQGESMIKKEKII